MATYLVTGGAGFIGSSIAEKLLASGETVRILDDFSTGRRQNLEGLEGNLQLIEGTICDPMTVAKAVRGVDVVFHEAAIPSVSRSVENPTRDDDGLRSRNDDRPRRGEARGSAPRRLRRELIGLREYAHPPQGGVDGPLAALAVRGGQARRGALDAGLRAHSRVWRPCRLLRYFNVFGPRQDPTSQYAAVIPNFITAALAGRRPIVHGDGEQTRDFCFIDNTVTANLQAATCAEQTHGAKS